MGVELRRLRVAMALASVLGALPGLSMAAPDEDKLGKAAGYPVGTARTWFFDESVRVGSFSHQHQIPGIFQGRVHELKPAAEPLRLPRADQEPDFRWATRTERGLRIDDYLQRQRTTALLIVKDGQLLVERYQYERRPDHRFLSNSMAKTITALGVGLALREGKIASLDDRADQYAERLRGTLYGETSIRNLLRMASGARFEERYDGQDDLARYGSMSHFRGMEIAASVITERAHAPGERFNYASTETNMLAAVLRAATGMSLSQYLQTRLWQPMGAEFSAHWRTDVTGLEAAGGNFNAAARDYARLGMLLANDGRRPDKPELGEIVPQDFLLQATDWRRHDAAFQPRVATPYYGYGYQVWTFPTEPRRFALLGVYGQAIFVDPGLKLVMVHLAVNATARAGGTSMGAELDALWRGVLAHYGRWDAGRFAR